MQMITADGARLAVVREGEGAPVVLIHGSWGDHHGWDRVAPGLSEAFDVIRYDRRGHGSSEPASGTVSDDLSDLAGLLDALGVAPAHLVGSSFGGVLALKMATHRPSYVRSVVAHEPPVTSLEPPSEDDVAVERRVLDLIQAGDRGSAARTFVEEMAFGPGAWEALPRFQRDTFVRHAHTFAEERGDPEVDVVDLGRLGAFPRPILLTEGTASPPLFGRIIRRLIDAAPRIRHHVYPDAGHIPQATHAREYVRVVKDFLLGA